MTNTIYKPLPAFKPLYKPHFTLSTVVVAVVSRGALQTLHCLQVCKPSIACCVVARCKSRLKSLCIACCLIALKRLVCQGFTRFLRLRYAVKTAQHLALAACYSTRLHRSNRLKARRSHGLKKPRPSVSAVYAEYIEKQRDDCTVVQINYTDNPHCPELLKIEAEKLRESDPEAYDNIWLGRPKYIADGAVYKNELAKARSDGRITRVPIDPALKVHTVWDLGVSDSTTIWFVQVVGKEVRVVDYYEATGEGLPHYARILEQRGYLYGKHFAPHDIAVRELGSGVSRIETAKKLGINFEIVKNVPIEDGIEASRQILSSCWFDTDKCSAGLHALSNYRREYNDKMGEFKARPVHDWASHAADAFRYLALSVQAMHVTPPPPPPSMPKRTHHWNRR